MKPKNFGKQNRITLALLLLAIVLAGVLMSLPLYSFDASIYTKKSANTFVGDEKYVAVLAEVNAVADEYRANGMEVTLKEEVTERTNSKGVTTSLVAFTLSESFSKNLWSFLSAGLRSSFALTALVACLALSVLTALLGARASLDTPIKELDERTKRLRSASAVFALLALLLVPVFVMMNTYTFGRELTLMCDGVITEGKDALFAKLNGFLFNGLATENLETVLDGLAFSHSWKIWLLLPAIFIAILSAVQLRFGAIQNTLLRGLMYAFIIVVCIVAVYPYYVMIITGFRSNAETTDMYFMHVFPTKWEWSNIKQIVSRGVPRYLLNSLIIAGGGTLVAMICGIPAAYSMARRNFGGKKLFLGFIIMSQMFSPVVLLIGISQLMSTINLNDNVFGLVLINAAFNQAFAIWLLRGTFLTISPEMEQAAMIDGCSTLGALWKVLLPMAAPGIVTALIFVFINAWNEYTIATVLIATATNRPITVGITQFSSFNMIEWQYLFAAALIATIPVVILFMCIEKHLTAGLTSGGVKG